MEGSRKIIQFGESSYVVSLPKEWVRRNNLKKSDALFYSENGNGELIFYPNSADKKEEVKEATIIADNKDALHLEREIMSAYVNNCNIIKIIGEIKERQKIEKILNNLLALQIIEESSNKIIAKDFLNIKDVSIKDIIRRMDFIIKVMLEESVESIEKSNRYEDIASMDKSINKLKFLVYRLIKNVFKNPNKIKLLDVSLQQFLSSWIIVSDLEQLSDECRRFTRFLKMQKLNDKEKKAFLDMLKEINLLYSEIMKAYYNNNKILAHSVLAKKGHMIDLCNETFNICDSKVCGPMIEKMKSMVTSVRNIGRVIVDQEDE